MRLPFYMKLYKNIKKLQLHVTATTSKINVKCIFTTNKLNNLCSYFKQENSGFTLITKLEFF